MPPVVPLHPWARPDRPWSRVHIDYAGPFEGTMFLLLIDAHSKWLEIHQTNTSTSMVTIELMRKSFSALGDNRTIVRHFDQLRPRVDTEPTVETSNSSETSEEPLVESDTSRTTLAREDGGEPSETENAGTTTRELTRCRTTATSGGVTYCSLEYNQEIY